MTAEQPREAASATVGTVGRTPRRLWSPGSPAGPRNGARRTVAAYDNYEQAERAVDRLSDLSFPVERVAIVGQDLQTVEQVTGRMNYPRSAWRGAASGAVPGALIGWIFGVFNWVDPLITSLLLAVYGLVIGAAIGAIIGLIVYAMQRGRRDFESVTIMSPKRFEVVVDDEVAEEAARLLLEAGI
jgi:hypothetical protein